MNTRGTFSMLFLLLGLSVLLGDLHSQNHDYSWVLGTFGNQFGRGGVIMRFSPELTRIDTFDSSTGFLLTNSSYSDADGNLLVYSNGCDIRTAEHENIGEINENTYHDDKCPWGLGTANGILFLPFPNNESKLAVFHPLKSFSDGSAPIILITDLLYTLIDLGDTLNSPTILFKDSSIVQDTLDYSYMSATKHGNGRDWWIIMPVRKSAAYYSVLLGPTGVEKIGKKFAKPKLNNVDFASEGCFSPNGTWYAKANNRNKIRLFNFDRCEGELYNGAIIDFPLTSDSSGRMGLAFSSNSRFLYASVPYKIFQYDLWANDVEASRVVVAKWDGVSDPFPTQFSFMELAPDGKIYVKTANSDRYLHVIDQPNEKGIACNVIQRGLILPHIHDFSIPSFPGNYRLGPLPDKCATATQGPEINIQIQLYPNPFTSELKVMVDEGSKDPWSIQFFNALGREVLNEEVNKNGETLILGLKNHPPGILFYRITDRLNQVVKSGKVVKQ